MPTPHECVALMRECPIGDDDRYGDVRDLVARAITNDHGIDNFHEALAFDNPTHADYDMLLAENAEGQLAHEAFDAMGRRMRVRIRRLKDTERPTRRERAERLHLERMLIQVHLTEAWLRSAAAIVFVENLLEFEARQGNNAADAFVRRFECVHHHDLNVEYELERWRGGLSVRETLARIRQQAGDNIRAACLHCEAIWDQAMARTPARCCEGLIEWCTRDGFLGHFMTADTAVRTMRHAIEREGMTVRADATVLHARREAMARLDRIAGRPELRDDDMVGRLMSALVACDSMLRLLGHRINSE